MRSTNSLLSPGLTTLSIVLSAHLGLLAQASSPDYVRLYLWLVPAAIANLPLLAVLFYRKPKIGFGFAAVPALLAYLSFLEMTLRVLS